jgi:hypothetical protein
MLLRQFHGKGYSLHANQKTVSQSTIWDRAGPKQRHIEINAEMWLAAIVTERVKSAT